jgi:hypothetical protein
MNTEASFPFSLDFEDHHYSGTITPSGDTDNNGVPVYFRVMIGNEFFAYLCCGEFGWGKKDNDDEGDTRLVQTIGEFIKAQYA